MTVVLIICICLIGVLSFLAFYELKKIEKILNKISELNNPLTSDISLVDEVINYLVSKGKEPTFGEDTHGVQYFAFTNDKNEIINITPVEDVEYVKNTSAWRRRRSELFKIIDNFLEEKN
jgi:hypothetical protein